MKHLFTPLLFAACLTLAACGTSNSTGDSLVEIVKAEKGETFTSPGCEIPDNVIGKSFNDINNVKFKGPVRVIAPNASVSGDHVANRINLKTDKKGIIRSASCG